MATAGPEEAAAINYQMAQLYQMDGQPAKQIEALEAAVKESNDATLRVQLAGALHAAKRDKEALDRLKEASKHLDENPSQPSPRRWDHGLFPDRRLPVPRTDDERL